jgi:sigma-B regulation protein RsbU (phosphoserine phosphatase)
MEDTLQQPIRAVRFPLKLKFTLTLGLLLVATVATFLFLATRLIREDKAAYVYDAILMRTEQQAATIEARLSSWRSILQSPPSSDQLRTNFPEIQTLWDKKNLVFKRNEKALGENLPSAPWQMMRSYLVMDGAGRRIVIELSQLAQETGPFKLGLYSQDGRVLVDPSQKLAMVEKDHWLWELLSQPTSQGVRETKNQLIVAYAKISTMGWVLTSQLDKSAAFAVAGYLVDKSIFFGLLILGVAILVGILAVRPLTSQLEDLTALTDAVGGGDFSRRVKPRTHDEAGALADSFNMMAEKITVYMGEMKEKARLENELKVAQLVQKAFFPPSFVELSGVAIQSFAAPATECGGDWWGHVDFGDTVLIMIADATGHGVPAALLTATANACKEGLKALSELDPTLPQTPARVMQYLNRTVCSSGDQIQMTCFVASWHRPSRTLGYCNASHPPALVFVAPAERQASKEDLRPLLEANGPRLGQQRDALYTQNYVELPDGARIVLYSDGLTEASDPAGQAWGQRRFMKALIESFTTQDGTPQYVVDEMLSHHQRATFDDDVTLVSVRFT